MNLAVTVSRASIGINAPMVTVETHISNGLPALHIVGLPETVVKESKDRVRSAILNSHFEFPVRRITVNLAPADLPKHGGRFDLAIALGILAASRQIPFESLADYEFAGELALSGQLRAIAGILPFALATKNNNRKLILPTDNAQEAALICGLDLLPANSLLDVCSHFMEKSTLARFHPNLAKEQSLDYPDLNSVKGQHLAKRALVIAAAGAHSLLLVGPPGVGKTLLSHCLAGILPPMLEQEAVELAAIQSVAGHNINKHSWRKRPFRAPHHSASSYALIGGGNPPKPGEISLSHNGILFLDELPEFKRQTLEALREPLESGTISISRANSQIQYPAKFQLIAAMNPCPCGQYGNPLADCSCPIQTIKKYQARISGPLLDRIDLQVELLPLTSNLLLSEEVADSSAMVLSAVLQARAIQENRIGKPNALLTNKEISEYCLLHQADISYIEQLLKIRKISARSYHKILKIARTIADLESSSTIELTHLKEAVSYRYLETMKKS